MQMILNELSADFPICTREEGKRVMSDFLNLCKRVGKKINNDSLILDKYYDSFQLARDYHISEWRSDTTVDKEEQRLFRSILNRSVVYDGREIDDVKMDLADSQFEYESLDAKGCLIAFETDNFVLSFKTHDYWKEKFIKGLYLSLLEPETLDEPREVNVLNLHSPDDLSVLDTYFADELNEKYEGVKSGRELLQYVQEWFPSIVFCDNAIKQLKKESTTMNIRQIIRKLIELNDYFSTLEGNFDMDALKNCSPESEATLNEYKDDHTFRTPDGVDEIFSFHLRYTGTYAGRIFFKPSEGNKKCIVAHIGKKLKNHTYH